MKRLLVLVCVMLFLTGCAGVGIVATNDPLTKLNDADHLFKRQNRPLPAERLIREAIEIYKERSDAHGLGLAYQEYAELLMSSSVKRYEQTYRRDGFQDKSITFDNRIEKSNEYFSKAEKKFRKLGELHRLPNTYYYMARNYHTLNQIKESCTFFDKSLAAHYEYLRLNPKVKLASGPGGKNTASDGIKWAKQRVGCK